ncbi:MerR family transcriptional regulator [uncultured Robinsoniella sp.]|uniref:MerR family transcriptional regulator n=1 Tax=uncultured Robinsoniella sp. TaxID=904190 RepID=UPI00374F37F0
MNTYKTADIARMFHIHVNTVRLYEKCRLIPKPERLSNGYRVFTDLHVEQLKLARAALQAEMLQNGLRKKAVDIIKTSAAGDYEKAAELTHDYMEQVEIEIGNAEEAIQITHKLLSSMEMEQDNKDLLLTRKDTADYLHVTIDTLRNWELNGLFSVKRLKNGYRVYSADDLQRLKIIRSLRCANYSLSSILRMLNALSIDPGTNIREIINTPKQDDDIITACDKLLTSLQEAKENALFAAGQIEKMKRMAGTV